eukprot:4939305-Ditylum_brightwellii.AAC.1
MLQHAVKTSYDIHTGKTVEDTKETYDRQFLQHATEQIESNTSNVFEYLCHYLFNQMSANQGIKKHGQVAVDALLKEFAQLDDLTVLRGIHTSLLTPTQKQEALRAINLIKEKRCGRIKGRTIADGRSQQKKYEKQNITSPTVTNEGLMMSL